MVDRRAAGSLGRRSVDRKWPRHLRDFWMLCITGLVVLALGNINSTTREVGANQRANTRALCAFQADLHRRYSTGVAYLKTHPQGVLGLSAKTIRVQLAGQASTLKALRPLVC